MILVSKPPKDPIFKIPGLTLGQRKLILDKLNMILKLLLDWQISKILPQTGLTPQLLSQFNRMTMHSNNFNFSQIILPIILPLFLPLGQFLLMVHQLRTTHFTTATEDYLVVVTLVNTNLIIELPLAIANIFSIFEQKLWNLLSILKFLTFDCRCWVSGCVLVIFVTALWAVLRVPSVWALHLSLRLWIWLLKKGDRTLLEDCPVTLCLRILF